MSKTDQGPVEMSPKETPRALVIAALLIEAARHYGDEEKGLRITLPQLHKLVLLVEMMVVAVKNRCEIQDEAPNQVLNHVEWVSINNAYGQYGEGAIYYTDTQEARAGHLAGQKVAEDLQQIITIVCEIFLECKCHSMAYITQLLVDVMPDTGYEGEAQIRKVLNTLSTEMDIETPSTVSDIRSWLEALQQHATRQRPFRNELDQRVLSLYEMKKYDYLARMRQQRDLEWQQQCSFGQLLLAWFVRLVMPFPSTDTRSWRS